MSSNYKKKIMELSAKVQAKTLNVTEGTFKILGVHLDTYSLSVSYSVSISQASLGNLSVEVEYPNGDNLYSIGTLNVDVEGQVERPIRAFADGTTAINNTAEDKATLQQQADTLLHSCKNSGIFDKEFSVKPLKTANYTVNNDVYSIYAESLFNGRNLLQNEQFEKILRALQDDLNKLGLI